jgi:hypothetical protein
LGRRVGQRRGQRKKLEGLLFFEEPTDVRDDRTAFFKAPFA